MHLELVSFKLCPYMHRAAIALKHLDLPHTISYVPPQDMPDWIRHASPTGQTPVLKVDDRAILFESSAITEFVDDIAPGSIQPADPVRRALNRAWIAYAADCIAGNFSLISAESEAGFQDAHRAMLDKLAKLEAVLADGPFFNGGEFSLVDCAYAPLFARLRENARRTAMFPATDLPRVQRWSEALLAHPSVTATLPGDFSELYATMLGNLGGYLGGLAAG